MRGATRRPSKRFATRGVLSYFIPEEYGGGGAGPLEVLSLLEAASYESLPLGLTIGINIGLFLQPLTKYGGADIKRRVFFPLYRGGSDGRPHAHRARLRHRPPLHAHAFERRGEEYAGRGRQALGRPHGKGRFLDRSREGARGPTAP